MDQIEKLELKISYFLRWGVIISGTLMLIGLSLMLFETGESFLGFKIYSEISFKQTILMSWDSKDYAKLISFSGLIVLISLPLLRILLTAVLFFKQKELVLASIATGVFFTLIASFFLGLEL